LNNLILAHYEASLKWQGPYYYFSICSIIEHKIEGNNELPDIIEQAALGVVDRHRLIELL
ncbi:hypothetical protein, partial [Legionella maceachernii]